MFNLILKLKTTRISEKNSKGFEKRKSLCHGKTLLIASCQISQFQNIVTNCLLNKILEQIKIENSLRENGNTQKTVVHQPTNKQF